MRLPLTLTALLLVLSACAPHKEIVDVIQGAPGIDGRGTSCTVYQAESGAYLNCQDGSSVYISNGAQGSTGPAGEAGEDGENGQDGSSTQAALYDYSGSVCTEILDTGKYLKKSGSNFKLYTSSACSSSTAFAEVSQGESYWVNSTTLSIWASATLRVVAF